MNTGRLIASGAISFFLASACVSTTTGTPERKADSVDAANLNYTLGVKYYQSGSYDLARDRLVLATEQNPKLAAAHTTLGMTYEALENPRLATVHHKKAVSIAPRDFNVLNAYAVYLCRQKDYEAALRHFDRAIAHPENDNSQITMTNAGVCVLQKPDMPSAERYFRAALDKKSNYGEALLQLCLIKFGEQDYLSARAFLQRYMSSNASTAGVLYLASRIEDMLGNDRGRTDFENRLIRDFPTSPEARKVLGSG